MEDFQDAETSGRKDSFSNCMERGEDSKESRRMSSMNPCFELKEGVQRVENGEMV